MLQQLVGWFELAGGQWNVEFEWSASPPITHRNTHYNIVTLVLLFGIKKGAVFGVH